MEFQANRTAGSHSEFDLVAWKRGDSVKKVCFVAFVQCKTPARGLSVIIFFKTAIFFDSTTLLYMVLQFEPAPEAKITIFLTQNPNFLSSNVTF